MFPIHSSVLALLLTSCFAAAAPPSKEAVDQFAADYFAKRPSLALASGMNLVEARQVQQDFLKRLAPQLGRPVGYKAGLVTKEAQARFGVSEPVRGTLLRKMMLKDGAVLPVTFGTRPIVEADLIVVVKDAGINQARTPLEVAQHLKEVVAFIELPDSLIATNRPMDAGLFIASNVGARLGVLGQRVKMRPTPEFVTAMAEMIVTMSDDTGEELGRAPGKLILGNPLNAVSWLAQDLAANGGKLKAGDLLSLGSLKAIPPPAGRTITVRYEGLPGGPIAVSVRFTGP